MSAPFFSGQHDIGSRDKTRDWSLTQVKTAYFDASQQPVASYQNPWELGQILEIYHQKAPEKVLELGPYHGGTLYHWIKNAAPGAQIAAVDFFDELLGGRQAFPEDWAKWAEDRSKEVDREGDVLDYSIDFQFFQGNTHDPNIIRDVSAFFGAQLDWLFIDANHEYDHCRRELEDYGRMIRPGGVICFHDVRPRNMGSHRLFEEMRQAGYVSQLIVADPYSEEVDAGIGVIYL